MHIIKVQAFSILHRNGTVRAEGHTEHAVFASFWVKDRGIGPPGASVEGPGSTRIVDFPAGSQVLPGGLFIAIIGIENTTSTTTMDFFKEDKFPAIPWG